MSVQQQGTEIQGSPPTPSPSPTAPASAPDLTVTATPVNAPVPPIVVAAPSAPAPETATPPEATTANGKNLILPREAFNARLRAASAKGKREALEDLETRVKASGFSSFEDMLSSIARNKEKPVEVAPEVPTPGADRADRKNAKEIERERHARVQERKGRLRAERDRTSLERERESLQAEMVVREAAIMAGIRDKRSVNYAMTLLRDELENKTVEELKDFDESKFFENLREQQPYLFNETVRPATTGTGGQEPSSPRPGTVNKATAANGQTDVKKMNRQEFDTHLQKMGLRPPSHIV